MTSLIAWTGVDSRSASSIYLAADSRLSFGVNDKWDQGRKLFAAHTQPEILGYCGDVLFPSQAIGQVIALIDAGALTACENAESKAERVKQFIDASLGAYPTKYTNPFSILYCTRIGLGMNSRLACFELVLAQGAIATEIIPLSIPSHSGEIAVKGSGATTVSAWITAWQKSKQPNARTSRAIFGAFCDAVNSGMDPATGGAVQLVGLFRKGPAQTFGFCKNTNAYIYGMPTSGLTGLNTSWRNELFELCDPSGNRLPGAQAQPRPNDIVDPT